MSIQCLGTVYLENMLMMGVNSVPKNLSVHTCFIDNDQEGHDSFAQALSSGKINKASNLVSNKETRTGHLLCPWEGWCVSLVLLVVYSLISAIGLIITF